MLYWLNALQNTIINSEGFQIIEISYMYQREQFSSLNFNANRERPQRPQTPGPGNSNPFIGGQFNKSYTKNPGNYSPHHYPAANQFQPRNPNISKSRLSVSSNSQSQLSFLNADQGEIFPDDLLFLLKNEQKNINNFKEKIQREKAKVENDFSVLKAQIQHALQDLKLSVQAELDLVYKVFMSKYAEVKSEVQEIRRLRKQILMANQMGLPLAPKQKDSSNNDIITEIEKDAEHFRSYRVYGYLSEMQKQKITPILQICNDIILIGSIDSPFYRSKEMSQKHKEIKAIFSSSLGDVFNRLADYVISPEALIEKEREEEEKNNILLNNLEQQNGQSQSYQPPQRQAFDVMYPENKGFDFENNRKKVGQFESWQEKPSEAIAKKIPISRVSRTQKGLVTKWAENVNLKKLQRVVTDHNDAILCIYFVENRHIATGSKDKTINVYTFDGKRVVNLRGHDASICSLSSVSSRTQQTLLASGGDHGCCCLILWDTKSWTIASRIQSHTAAVTSIVDLQDGEHLVTGSYDKKINLYNHARGQVIGSYSNKSAVTSIVLSADKQRLISSGLENTLIVWSIMQRQNGLTLEIVRTINTNSMVCILEASALRPELIIGATRDGKIKTFNINAANQVQKVYSANQNSIIELNLIERQMKADSPMALTCSSKDKSLCLTRMDTGQSEQVRVNGACNVEFGCGIGPKIVISPQGIMAILSQSNGARQFSLFEVELK